MGSKRKKRKNLKTKKQRPKLTMATVIGLAIGLLLIGAGVYSAVGEGEMGGYWVVGLGLCFTAAVCWGSFRSR